MENRIGFGKRFVAYILDGIVILIGGVVLGTALGGMFGGALGGLAGNAVGSGDEAIAGAVLGGFMGAFLGALIGVYFFAVFYNLIEAFSAASPGKMLLGIKIANDDGTSATKGTLFLRYLIKNIAFVSSSLAILLEIEIFSQAGNLLGFIVLLGCFMIFNKAKQGIHDKIVKTAVYHRSFVEGLTEFRKEELSPLYTAPVEEEGVSTRSLVFAGILILIASSYYFSITKYQETSRQQEAPKQEESPKQGLLTPKEYF